MTVNELITQLDLMPADADVWLSLDDDEITTDDFTVVLDQSGNVLLKAD